ncbi:MAG: DegT/DnrJ/EryC1/StrS family aminotransferase, partial [Ruminococcus sp.]|nr:DegT/DnrJ/EryC1/StrS family aminotransferase [Ruminococcus sp.]
EGLLTPKAVIAVDLFGLPADYENIRKICEKYNLYLMEDGAQGFGGSINGKMACSFGDISTTSFFPAKPLGCYGDGGAVFTDNDEWASLLRSYAVHGKNGSDKYDNCRIGMNSRLDTLQAAVLLPKFKAFKEYEIDNVNIVAAKYGEKLRNSGLVLPLVPDGYVSSWAQYTVQLSENIDRDKLISHMRDNGIPSMVYYARPMHTQGAFVGTRSALVDNEVTQKLCKTVLSLPMHPYLESEDINKVCDCVLEFLSDE